MKVVSPTGITVDWHLGDIITHSTDNFNGIGSGPSNVIWTSPLNGTIDVSGGVWMGRDIGRGNHWEISKNGIVLTGGDISSGDPYQRSNPFTFSAGSGGPAVLNQIQVLMGDVLRLQITRTTAPGDYAGVNLSITACIAGDFNCDEGVNAADYVVLRKNFASDQSKYNEWRANFGNEYTGGGNGSNNATVPEPTVASLVAMGTLAISVTAVRRRRKSGDRTMKS
jgi:hypothetical protein